MTKTTKDVVDDGDKKSLQAPAREPVQPAVNITSGQGEAKNGQTIEETISMVVDSGQGDEETTLVALDAYVADERKPTDGLNSNAILVEGVVEPANKGTSKTLLLGAFTLLGAMALIVGLSVGLGKEERQIIIAPAGSDIPSASPTSVVLPTLAPTIAPTSEAYIDVIEQLSFEFPNMTIAGDNQLAAIWMAEDGFYQLPILENATDIRYEFRQRFAMATFYYATSKSESGWIDDCNFLSSYHICNWTCPLPDNIASEDPNVRAVGWGFVLNDNAMGVACLSATIAGGIEIVENGLSGTIPNEIHAINFPGVIEPFISLSLQGNELTGTIPFDAIIPTDIDNPFPFLSLYLGGNQLTGTIPPDAPQRLSGMILMNLAFNQLSGPLPSSMPSMIALGQLLLDGNNLSGSLDDSRILEMPSCQTMSLSDNMFTGTIPDVVRAENATSVIRLLYLGSNLLSGSIPDSLVDIGSLRQLLLNDNMLSGSIPESISELSNLNLLNIARNALTSSLPSSLNSMTSLSALVVENNFLTGTPLANELFHNLSLSALRLSTNNFTGPVKINPDWAPAMVTFHILGNQHTGTIPTEIGLLTNMEYLTLALNDLTGTMPTELGQLSNVGGLWAYGLNVTGSLSGFCEATANVGPEQGYIADCLEPGGVECSCCTECCDKRLVGGSVEPQDGEEFADYCRAV